MKKTFVHSLELFVDENYENMVLARRCIITGEKFKPYKNIPDAEQPSITVTANGVYLGDMLNTLLKLEYQLKQKYNKEGDK